jgi:MFS family permease
LITPTLHAILPGVVDRRDLGPALTLQSITFNGTRAVGPVIGAIVFTQFGPAEAFAINAAAFALLPILLPFIRVAPRDAVPEGTLAGSGGIWASLRIANEDRRLLVLILLMTVVGMGTDPVLTLGPSLAAALGAAPAFAGTLVSAFGVGSVVIAPFINRIRLTVGPVRSAQFGFITMATGLVGLTVAPTQLTALVTASIAGAGFLTASADLTTVLQELVPDAVRGRIMSLWTVSYLGSRPVAALLSGSIADFVHVRAGVGVIAMIVVVAAVVTGRQRPKYDWTATPQPSVPA